jgi:hypothetical protein
MRAPSSTRPFLALSVVAAAALVVACGGGDDAPVSTAISGNVVKGPVSGATVCAFKATAAGKGEQLQCVTSSAGGAYAMNLEYTGDVVIEASGGSYTDEATGASRTLSDPMQVVLSAQGGTAVGMVTPLTSVAYSLSKAASGGVTSASFATSASNVAAQFQLGAVNIASAAPVVTGTPNGYGNVLRAVSKFVANGGTQAAFQAYVNPGSFQAAFASAYAAINGTTVTFTFSGAPVTGTVTPGTGGTTTTPGGSTAGGAESCGITVSGSGTTTAQGMTIPFTLPPTKVCVTGLPAGSCSAGNSQLQNIATSGAAPSGNFTVNYNYSYAPNDCAGAISTVAYQ